MADTKISAMTAATVLGDTDELVLAVSGANKKITGANLKTSMPAGTAYRVGTGAPSSGLGSVNDLYEDLATGDLYQKQNVASSPAFRSKADSSADDTSSHSCAVPAGVAVGDVLIAIVHSERFTGGAPSTPTLPSGWTKQGERFDAGNAIYLFSVFTKIADGSEGSSVAITTPANTYTAISILAYSGGGAYDAIADYGSVQTGTTPTIPSVTTSVNNCMVLGLLGAAGSTPASATPASGWTERSEKRNVSGGTLAYSMERLQATAGASPTAQPTISAGGSPTSDLAFALSIKPGSGTATWVLIRAGGISVLSYVEFTSSVAISASSDATADTVVTAASLTVTGSTLICVEFYCPNVTLPASSSGQLIITLAQGGSSIGRLAQLMSASTSATQGPSVFARRYFTPAAGTYTWSVRAWTFGGGSTISAGAGGSGNLFPGYIRITSGG